jgi:chemotaxis protein methyltransferase CheR
MLRKGVRLPVDFRYLNLAQDLYPALSTDVWGMDIILCRNVLIYFDEETIARVGLRLLASLAQGGWLLLSATDPPLHELVPCEAVQTEAGLAYKRAGLKEPSRTVTRQVRDARREPSGDIPVPPPPAPRIEPPPRDAASVPVRSEPAAVVAAQPQPPEPATIAAAYEARQYERAIQLGKEAVARESTDARAWAFLIRSLANLGRLTEAGEACAAALDGHRLDPEIAYLHAVLLAQAGEHSAAAAAARGALYLERDMIVAHLTLADALSRSGDSRGAARSFANAARLLERLDPAAVVPWSDGEPAGRLLEMTRAHMRLATRMAS